jgi:hypothetical protein
MTRRSIATILGSFLVGLLLVVNISSVAAADMGGGGSAPVITAGGACARYAPEHCELSVAAQAVTRFIPAANDDPSGTIANYYSMGSWQHGADNRTTDAAPQNDEQMLPKQASN